MFRTYHFSIPLANGKIFQSDEYDNIDEFDKSSVAA